MILIAKKISYEIYLDRLNKCNPNIVSLEEIINLSTKSKHKCMICEYEWYPIPDSLLRNHGCPNCAKNKYLNNLKHNKKSHEQYINEVHNINPDIEVIGQYINSKTKILHRCRIDNNEWYSIPSNILRGRKCPICSEKHRSSLRRKNHKDYVTEVENKVNNIEVLGTYVNAITPIRHRCKKDGNIWNISPNNLLRGYGCPICKVRENSLRFAKTQEQYMLEVNNLNKNIEVVGKYINAFTPILHKCKIHNREWYEKPTNILHGSHCPECTLSYSKGESLIKSYLNMNNINCYIHHYYNDLRGVNNGVLSYDFYLPKYNILIEFQGIQHERPVEHFGGQKIFIIQQIHDIRKRKYAKNHNIKLITIWYNQLNDISHILNNYLNNLKSESLTTAG